MKLETILYDKKGPVGFARLNRPERMNAVSERMYRDLMAVLAACRRDESLRVLVLTGTVSKRESGDKQVFCAGADLKEHSAGTRDAEQRRKYIHLAHEATRSLFDFPKPVIAAVNGPARGAGAEMALNCDFIVMADEASIAFPETGLGTFVGGGTTHILERIVGLAGAKELIYTGRVLKGHEAVEIGLAIRSVPAEKLLDEASILGRLLAEKAPISMKMAKDLLHRGQQGDIAGAIEAETKAILDCMQTDDWREGARAFTEKRAPDFKGK